jgi:hypothetical protein
VAKDDVPITGDAQSPTDPGPKPTDPVAPADPATPIKPLEPDEPVLPANGGIVRPTELPAEPVSAPVWVMAIGAVAGLLTLGGFFIFAFLAATNSRFVCNSFPLLAPIFAFGVGLSVAFLGGAAAINGQLGDAARKYSLAFSAGGGVAALFIAFLLFQQFQPNNCDLTEATLELTEIPMVVTAVPDERLWNKREDNVAAQTYTISHLISSTPSEYRITLRTADLDPCILNVEIVADVDQITEMGKNYTTQKLTSPSRNIKLVYVAPNSSNALKASGLSCFTTSDHEIGGYIAASAFSQTILIGEPAQPNRTTEVDADEAQFGVVEYPPVLLEMIFPAAFAQSGPPAFSVIKEQLLSKDPAGSTSARQYLTENFPIYQNDIIAEFLSPDAPAGDYLASILSALIGGINSATGDSIKPGTKRDLSQPLPDFIAGHEDRIVELTAHEDAAVRKQARRLVQRFPVDAFDSIYAPLLQSAANSADCVAESAEEMQAKLYGAIFYEYNRIVQFNVEAVLTMEDSAVAEGLAKLTLDAARCLTEDLRVDSALLFFGLATIYNEAGANPRQKAVFLAMAKERARSFLEVVDANGGRKKYYYGAHVDRMIALAA